MDKRWSNSQFAGLPSKFVQFAKRLDLQYKAKKELLVDRDGEPVAWLLEDAERRVSEMAGLPILEVVLWHPDGEAKTSYEDLGKIRTRDDLLEFQGKPLRSGEVGALSIQDVLEDSKERAVRNVTRFASIDRQLGSEDETFDIVVPDLAQALEVLGTVGVPDVTKRLSPDGPLVMLDFEGTVGLKPEEIAPRAARPRGKN